MMMRFTLLDSAMGYASHSSPCRARCGPARRKLRGTGRRYNKAIRQIAEETGFTPTTVHRKLKKAEKLGYQPNVTSAVPSQDGEGRIQPRHDQRPLRHLLPDRCPRPIPRRENHAVQPGRRSPHQEQQHPR